jgi:hypothetical protein
MRNMDVTIYLRSVSKDKKKNLAMFDTKGNGDINNLETVADPGSMIIWKLDQNSGIKKLNKISSREKKSRIFKNKPIIKSDGEIVLQLPPDLDEAIEAYIIEYVIEVTNDKGEKQDVTMVLDPYIRIEPPPL